ncbi:hypothetical protein [Paraflavitalea speifideaquila]|uniref:hypothetical protein n=1 Tax=Paraflavitalea speifideaquila TaxID=3076558 RepID=UPI0028ED62E6|nr:hypothetical protein [Paraflavitalea speifideiaquila]
MSTYNDLLLIVFILVTVPCFTYWMGYRSGEKSGELRVYKDIQDKSEAGLETRPTLSDSPA